MRKHPKAGQISQHLGMPYNQIVTGFLFFNFGEQYISKQIQIRFEHNYKHNSQGCFQKFC